MGESKLTIPSLRQQLHEHGFKGSVRSLDALRPVPERQSVCAVLHCSRRAPHAVFINTRMECDHFHLAKDVMALVDAHGRGHLDHGWDRLPNGDAHTQIMTRAHAIEAGIQPGRWASSPKKPDGKPE